MISDEGGTISFVSELVDAIRDFVEEYEEKEGALSGDLERGLVISYALGVMHCDLNTVWQTLGEATVFQKLHPRDLFEECVGEAQKQRPDQKEAIKQALQESPLQIDFD
ncbi:MAG: hypothetical protein U9R48_02495 [Chloroflexota bacterium]|nr:hypothetical protein [Chloroflexota bacterium]